MNPLADALRPKSLKNYIGQKHLVGEGAPLNLAIKQKHLFSFILWGPPGVGKTTLARIYANSLNAEFFELSAVRAGKDDIKKIIGTDSPGSNEFNLTNESYLSNAADKYQPEQKNTNNNTEKPRPKILFLDEIHRFNKAQQDFLLPFVESGQLTLIGATTENPSFEVIPALLSRCRVFVLNELSEEEMKEIVSHATGQFARIVQSGEKQKEADRNAFGGIQISDEAQDWLVSMAAGDARAALSMIENCIKLYGELTVENFKQTLQSNTLRYDKAGEEHYNTISAFIKSMRAGNPDASLYYLARMVEAGEDPLFIARRMVIFASEDIGLAQPTALVVANAVFAACQQIGYPECAINLAHGVAYLSNCKKDRAAYEALRQVQGDVKQYGNLPIPLNLRNAPTKLMKDLGYGEGYEMYPQNKNDENLLLPEKLKKKKYLNKY